MQQTVKAWAADFDIPVATLRQRIKRSGHPKYKSNDYFHEADFYQIGIDPETGAYTRKNAATDNQQPETTPEPDPVPPADENPEPKPDEKPPKPPKRVRPKAAPSNRAPRRVQPAKGSIVDAVFGSEAVTLTGSLVLVILGGFAFKVIAEDAMSAQDGAGIFWGFAGAFVHFAGLVTIYRVHKQPKPPGSDWHPVWNWIVTFFVFECAVHVCSLLSAGADNFFQVAIMAVCAPLATAGFSSVLFHSK